MTVIFQDGFETNDFSAWDGAVQPVDTVVQTVNTPVFAGNYAAEIDCNLTPSTPYIYKNFGAPVNPCHLRTYVYLKYLPINDNDAYIIAVNARHGVGDPLCQCRLLMVGSTLYWNLYIQDDALVIYNALSTIPAIQTDRWYSIELRRLSAVAGEGRLYIDGVDVADVTGIDTSDSGTLGIHLEAVGAGGLSAHVDNFYDSVVVADGYIGPETLSPMVGVVTGKATYGGIGVF